LRIIPSFQLIGLVVFRDYWLLTYTNFLLESGQIEHCTLTA
jgi:hypothetical protein